MSPDSSLARRVKQSAGKYVSLQNNKVAFADVVSIQTMTAPLDLGLFLCFCADFLLENEFYIITMYATQKFQDVCP